MKTPDQRPICPFVAFSQAIQERRIVELPASSRHTIPLSRDEFCVIVSVGPSHRPYGSVAGDTAIPACREIAEKVTEYLEGAMSFASRARVRLHLFQCTACTRYFDQMRRTIGLLADGPPPPPPADAVTNQVIAEMRRGARLQPGDD